ncbi:MAG: sigma-70 family RNA polymerase sigma factor [Planctomycetota bacterium]
MDTNKTKSMQMSQGDNKEVDALLERHLPWLLKQVRSRLGSELRKKEESLDFLQDTILQFLLYAPRIKISNEQHFRALLVRIVENTIRDKHGWYAAKRRCVARERPLPRDTILSLDPPKDRSSATPSEAVQRIENEAWLRLGLEIMTPEDRDLIVLRQWEECSFAEIGKRLGLEPKTAGNRYKQALCRLTDKIFALRRGKIEEALQ